MLLSSSARALLVCAAGALFATVASAQTKIAVVNLQQAVLQTAEIKKAQVELERKFKPRQDEIERLQKELQDLQKQVDDPKLSDAGRAQVTATGTRKQREAQRKLEDLQQDVDRERNEILGRAGQRMADVVKKLAEEKGLDIVVDITATIYVKPALEVTNDAVAAYDKAFPAK